VIRGRFVMEAAPPTLHPRDRDWHFGLSCLLSRMRKPAFDPCIPTRGTKVPDRPEWLHDIKHDGYRLIVQREGKTVRLWTRHNNQPYRADRSKHWIR
jgi:ATP-dependent DNA ligase